jgi:hypothetical protein
MLMRLGVQSHECCLDLRSRAAGQGTSGSRMDSEKGLKATAVIRQMVEMYPVGLQPKTAASQDAQRELSVVRENSPDSCQGKIRSISTWLNILFIPEKREKYGANAPGVRVEHIQASVLNILARIEAELIAQGRATA